MNGEILVGKAMEFAKKLNAVKEEANPNLPWYPYRTQANFIHLAEMFDRFPLDTLVAGNRIADIGAADGDLAFFMQSLGYSVDIIDYGPTNYNGLRGARLLVDCLDLKDYIRVFELNIDGKFVFPESRYGLVFLLGILYHLKNPYFILEELSKVTEYMVISTRVAKFAPNGQHIQTIPVAYLLDPDESNNDATNYWIFSEAGLQRLVTRAGWSPVFTKSVGDLETSNPSDQDRDERCFMLLRSRAFC
jgi:tRNA (mo5U34)-methyltransferase